MSRFAVATPASGREIASLAASATVAMVLVALATGAPPMFPAGLSIAAGVLGVLAAVLATAYAIFIRSRLAVLEAGGEIVRLPTKTVTLESVGARYFVGGSLASSLDGQPRATNDIDIDLPLGKIGAFASALGPDFEIDRDTLRDAVLHGRSANIFYLPQVLKIPHRG